MGCVQVRHVRIHMPRSGDLSVCEPVIDGFRHLREYVCRCNTYGVSVDSNIHINLLKPSGKFTCRQV
jgi:hypothetical protein